MSIQPDLGRALWRIDILKVFLAEAHLKYRKPERLCFY